MLSITVKTMDSQSRQFETPPSTKIKDFKEQIAAVVNVPASSQRLIFHGRVLQDDFLLTQEHDGKVLHLVQRMPVVTSSDTRPTTNAASPSITVTTADGAFNPGQLSQMILQQAVSGLGNFLVGGSISGNMVPNPSNPSEQIMNIQIDLNGPNPGTRPSIAATTTTSSGQSARTHFHEHRHANFSAPRQQLRMVERILVRLESVLDQLESQSDNSPESVSPPLTSSAGDADAGGDVFATGLIASSDRSEEPMDTGAEERAPSTATESDSQEDARAESSASSSPSAGSVPTSTNHPSLAELGTYYSRMLQGQRRLEPFINQMVTFLNNDPSFSSTQSTEYQNTASLLSRTLQAQQAMAEIQRLLSRVVIPLGRTPPRTMLVRAQPGTGHLHNDARRVPHTVHAGIARLASPMGRFPSAHEASPSAPILAGSGFRPRMIPVAHGVQMRWRMPSSSNPVPTPTSGPPITTNVTSARTGTATIQAQGRPASTAPSAGGPATLFSVQPPSYTVQVNAHVQPNVVFNVDRTANSSSETTTTSSTASPSRAPPANSGSTRSNVPASQSEQVGNIFPGFPASAAEVFGNLFGSVVQSAQQGGGVNGAQQIAGNVPGNAGVFLLGGMPNEQNSASDSLTNMIGQSVFNAVFNQLAGSTQTGNQPSLPVRLPSAPNVFGPPSSAANTGKADNEPEVPSSSEFDTPCSSSTKVSPQKERAKKEVKQKKDKSQPSTSRSPAAKPDASFNWTQILDRITDLFRMMGMDLTQGVRQFLAQFGINVNEDAQATRKSYLRYLFQRFCGDFTFYEIFQLLRGNPLPLLRLRKLVRSITARIYFGAADPTPSQLAKIPGEICENMRKVTEKFFADAQALPDVDIVESNLSLMRHVIQKALEIFYLADDAVFNREITQHARFCISLWVQLNESILRGGRKELVKLIKNSKLARSGSMSLFSGMSSVFTQGGDTAEFILPALGSLAPVSQNQIDQFVLSQAPGPVESDAPSTSKDKADVAETSQSRLKKTELPGKSHGNLPPHPSACPPTSTSDVESQDNWKKDVPSEWVDTIVADVDAQKNREAQMPFSDAYMAGMPASKRRKVVS